jgi:hypothetical protein
MWQAGQSECGNLATQEVALQEVNRLNCIPRRLVILKKRASFLNAGRLISKILACTARSRYYLRGMTCESRRRQAPNASQGNIPEGKFCVFVWPIPYTGRMLLEFLCPAQRTPKNCGHSLGDRHHFAFFSGVIDG